MMFWDRPFCLTLILFIEVEPSKVSPDAHARCRMELLDDFVAYCMKSPKLLPLLQAARGQCFKGLANKMHTNSS